MSNQTNNFTEQYSIEIHQSARGDFWPQIVLTETLRPKIVWEQQVNPKTRGEALDQAEAELERMAEASVEMVEA